MKGKLPTIFGLVCAISLSNVALVSSNIALGGVSGTVKDPKGAVIVGAAVTVRNEASGEIKTATTDEQGRFKIDGLAPGRYRISVNSKGFKTFESTSAIEDRRTATVDVTLEVAGARVEVGVSGKGEVAGNTDPNYRGLRDAQGLESYTVSNLTLKRDVGVINMKSGSISFLPPAMGRVVKGVFVGEGEFSLTPAVPIERSYLRESIEKDSVQEPFTKMVLCFTDETYKEIKRQAQEGGGAAGAKDVLDEFNKRMRYSTERPRSLVEAFLSGGEVENLDARILADLLNPKRAGFFDAYIMGRKRSDLRFRVRPLGAVPQLLGPEEVALINFAPGDDEEGFWYLAHFEGEYKSGTASSQEDKRVIDAEHYKIETVIDNGEKLTAKAEFTFTSLSDGERLIDFGLLPSLRVTRVSFGDRDCGYIQEKQKADGSFYVISPEPLVKGQKYTITIEYQGEKVVRDWGGGNFAVGARTSWYPSVNAFNDRATYDLTFKVPKKYTLIGVGKLAKQWEEGDFAASEWVSDVPLAVAGFNYGLFKKKEVSDSDTKYQIEGYATSDLPDYLREVGENIGGMTPTRLTDNGIVEAQNSIRIFSKWFGEAPYGRIAITQQPQFNFGQSWPTLVYLPIISFFDSTQRWMMMGRLSSRLDAFIQEVTPHEVAHQWWGHMVGWSSYHDQWLSEGFAEFSAGVYVQLTEQKPDKYLKFWDRLREDIVGKNQYGRRVTDVGPIWMGLRLIRPRSREGYRLLVYPKGAWVLQMLRWMMYDLKTGDQPFIDMMHDFVKSHFNQNASTESFKRIVEKHMTRGMNLDGNGKMDWFFNEWVYGTEVPSYKLEYTLTSDKDGKVILDGALTQSGVSNDFKMLVPVYLDFDGKIVRLGQASIFGNSSTPVKVRLPQRPKRVLLNANQDVLAVESASNGK